MTSRPTEHLLFGVQQYAREHYNEDGWSIVIEAWDDAETLSVIAGATTLDEALDAVRNDPSFDRLAEQFASADNRGW